MLRENMQHLFCYFLNIVVNPFICKENFFRFDTLKGTQKQKTCRFVCPEALCGLMKFLTFLALAVIALALPSCLGLTGTYTDSEGRSITAFPDGSVVVSLPPVVKSFPTDKPAPEVEPSK